MSSPHDIGPSLQGAKLVREALLEIERINERSRDLAGELLYVPIAAILEPVLTDPRTRRGAILALSEFLACAMQGEMLDPREWSPLGTLQQPQHTLKR